MKMKIKLGVLAPLFLVCIVFSERRIYTLIALFAAALHELCHILAAKSRKITLSSLSLDILGARLDTGSRLCSYRDEIILCAAGPLGNFLTSGIAFLIIPCFADAEYLRFFAWSSIALGTLNLLPIRSFDGGRILSAALSSVFSESFAHRIISALSFCSCFALWSFSVYLMIRAGASLSLFVFSLSLFSRIFISQ